MLPRGMATILLPIVIRLPVLAWNAPSTWGRTVAKSVQSPRQSCSGPTRPQAEAWLDETRPASTIGAHRITEMLETSIYDEEALGSLLSSIQGDCAGDHARRHRDADWSRIPPARAGQERRQVGSDTMGASLGRQMPLLVPARSS